MIQEVLECIRSIAMTCEGLVRLSVLLSVLGIAATASCTERHTSEICTQELGPVVITSPEQSLAVGATYKATAVHITCSGQHRDPFIGRWTSNDTAVATVDSTGLVRALTPGMVEIQAELQFRGGTLTGMTDRLRLTVR